MKDRARARRWRAWYDKGVKNFEKLWNGEYYVLWKEMQRGGVADECCMTDQIDGDWFTALMGWGSVLPPERIRAALRAILKYNYDSEDGLRNASYPPGKSTRLSTYKNVQADGLWTGIEYAMEWRRKGRRSRAQSTIVTCARAACGTTSNAATTTTVP